MADIQGTPGNDTLNGTADADTITGYAGNDTLDGGAGDDVVYGNEDNDTLTGGADNDLLDGGDGDDSLDGGAGADQLMGWAGNDIMFAFGADTVDGGAGNDMLTVRDGLGAILDGGAHTGAGDILTLDFSLAASGVTANLTQLWSALTNSGTIGSATVSNFETLGAINLGSEFDDSIVIGSTYANAVLMMMGAGNDSITGGANNDSFNGGSGNDVLNGGDGNDQLTDADGNSSLNGDGGDDTIIVLGLMSGSANGGFGTDHLRFDLQGAASGVTISLNASGGVLSGSLGSLSLAGFETVNTFFNKTTEHNDTVTIGASVDKAVSLDLLGGNDSYAGGSGNDYVAGGAGNDTLGGGAAGIDTLIGGIGDDSYVMGHAATAVVEAAGEGTDTVLASFGFALSNVTNVENLTLTGTGNIDGSGTVGANVITGNTGNNRIEAGDGNDTLHGGDGSDQLYGMEGNDTVNGDGGNDSIEDGVGTNTLNGGAGDDFIVLSGDAVNTANGGIGNDLLSISNFNRTTGFVINLTGMWLGGNGTVNGGTVTGFEGLMGFDGTQWADVINFGAGTTADAGINDAGAGNDVLTGTDGDNYINGGEGNDTIVSGAGTTDELHGGAGNDTITISVATGGWVYGGDGTDTLGLEPAEPDALNIDLTLLWGGGTGFVNGVAVSGIEVLQTNFIQSDHFVLSVADSVVIGAGYTGNLTMRVGRGADSVSGGSGNDIIDGEQDDDVIRGGAGNDSLGGSYASDYVYGDAGDDNISGDTLDVEWASGNDHLYGGDGNDTIDGGAYQDWLYGEAGNDVMHGDSAPLDLSEQGNDWLEGGAGIDQLFGHGGSDTLNGGTGADTMAGGVGDDQYHVDSAGDAVVEGAGEGANDRIFASVSYTLGAGVHVERLTTSDNNATTAINLTGNALANLIYGNAGANVLDGKVGADTLIGFAGDDWYYVDHAADAVTEGAGGGANDRIFASVSYTLGAGVEVEKLTTSDNDAIAAINLNGNELAQQIYGNAGNNVLDGKAGADLLNGLGGNDTLIGGLGNDTMAGGLGDDWYYVDSAGDVVVEAAGQGTADRILASVSYTLGAGVEVERLTTSDNLATTAINLTGSATGNLIYGNAGANILDGRGGADTLIGLGGDDWYYVDNALDKVTEAAGEGAADRVFASISYTLGAGVQVERLTTNDNAGTTAINLTGNELANMIYGNAGNNVLDGKGGADTLIGLDGADSFAFTTALGGGNVDAISGFVVADDTIRLDNAVFTGLADGALAAGAFATGSAATQADDRVIYNSATGALLFDADGAGGAAAVQFATLAAGLALTSADFLVV